MADFFTRVEKCVSGTHFIKDVSLPQAIKIAYVMGASSSPICGDEDNPYHDWEKYGFGYYFTPAE